MLTSRSIHQPRPGRHPSNVRPSILLYLPPGPVEYVGNHDHNALERLTAELPCQIVELNYRLDATHPYPTPIHDVLTGYDWVLQNLLPKRAIARPGRADHIGRIVVYGELIGGGLAAMLALTECRSGQPGIVAAALRNPVIDWVDLPLDTAVDRENRGYDSPQSLDTVHQLVRVREQLFTKPEHYFDSFASPMLFLRSVGQDIPSRVHQQPALDDMTQLMLHNREEYGDYTATAKEAQMAAEADSVQSQPQRKRAKLYPSPTLGLRLPAFHIHADKTSPLHPQAEEFARRLKQSHVRQASRADFGRKVLTEEEVKLLSGVEKQEYEDRQAHAKSMVHFSDVSKPSRSRALHLDVDAVTWLRKELS
ncbi:hypothetical protein LTR62_007037 [Meristemomyces frigidus]|uniref:Alpha/beta hydrolase fold-3 domain-containing protein n=1 Tax=Meristemomyces frigidus TaxID=1508187 RepID=A0AAN7TBG7_9PEZI|nr:hypothetical protein LTR62_007037 [Meristemomyces frigidus]